MTSLLTNPRFLARASLTIYFFFAIFGTSLPFRDAVSEVEDIGRTNIVNQIVFPVLYLLSAVGLLANRDRMIRFVKREKFLALFLAWAFLTILWSEFPLVSFKRWFRTAGSAAIFLSALLSFDSTEECLKPIRAIFAIYLPLSLLSIVLVPAAIQWEFPAWRGLAVHKNTLGQISLVSLLLWTLALRGRHGENRYAAMLFWMMSAVLLLGSRSATSILSGLVLCLFAVSGHLNRHIFYPVIGRFFTAFLIAGFLVGFMSVFYIAGESFWEYLSPMFVSIGKDPTFTGRSDLWIDVLRVARDHLIVGCGFAAFWGVPHPMLLSLFDDYVWLPNESHMGYLEILNETGLVGLFIFIGMVVHYFRYLFLHGRSHFSRWFILLALIVNVTESTLFRLDLLTGVMFTFAYIAFFVDADREFSIEER